MSNEMKNIFIVVPPVVEQKKIAEFLSEVNQKISDAEHILKNSITLLQEFKSSLITHAVTGKIKV
jgi:type I restriction enzyme S subunit